MVKSLKFFSTLQQVLYNWLFFVLVKSYPVSLIRLQCIVKKALFPPFDELFDNLKLGKEIIVLEKSLEKVSNFGSKYLYEACLILNVAYRNIFQYLWAFRQFERRLVQLAFSQNLTEKSISYKSGCELHSYMINLSF